MNHSMHCGVAGVLFVLALGLPAVPAEALGGWVEGEEADACANDDGAFDEAAFVLATEPQAGERVESGFGVEGCSRSFEGSVQWKLIARDGAELASGNTQG